MFQIDIDFSELNKLEQALVQLKEQMDVAMFEAMGEAEAVVHEEMVVHPQSIPYEPGNSSVHWDSPKQRAAYHATDGFFNGIPYPRVGALNSALQEATPTKTPDAFHGGVFAIEDWVKYVIGEKGVQSKIHAERAEPWRSVSVIGAEVRPRVVEIFQRAVNRVVESFKI